MWGQAACRAAFQAWKAATGSAGPPSAPAPAGRAGTAGLATHLIQRQQAGIQVESRVLDPLGGDRPRELLPAHRETQPLLPLLVAQIARRFEQQHAAEKIQRRLIVRLAWARGGDGVFHV